MTRNQMLNLLKLIPLKDLGYVVVILVIIAAFGSYTLHERHVQAAKDAAKDAALARAQIAHNIQVETHANQQIAADVKEFDKTVAEPIPLVDIPRILCNAAPAVPAVPDHDSTPSGSNDTPAVPEESTVPFNPAPTVVEDGRDADAQIKLLQGYIHACIDAGICKAK
jgi:hypothetical protein